MIGGSSCSWFLAAVYRCLESLHMFFSPNDLMALMRSVGCSRTFPAMLKSKSTVIVGACESSYDAACCLG